MEAKPSMGLRPPKLRLLSFLDPANSRAGPEVAGAKLSGHGPRSQVPAASHSTSVGWMPRLRFHPFLLYLAWLTVVAGICGLYFAGAQNLRMALTCLLASNLAFAAIFWFFFNGSVPAGLQPDEGRIEEAVGAVPGARMTDGSRPSNPPTAGPNPDPAPSEFDTGPSTGAQSVISLRIMGALLDVLDHPVYLATAGQRFEALNEAAERADRDSDLGTPITNGLLDRARRAMKPPISMPWASPCFAPSPASSCS